MPPFAAVTSDFGRTIERINERFGTSFRPFEVGEESRAAVIDRMERERHKRVDALGEGYRDPMRIVRQSADKEVSKDAMRAQFENLALSGPKAEARELYESLTDRVDA